MNALTPTAARVSRHELALARYAWLAQGVMFAFLLVATVLFAVTPLGLGIDPVRMFAFAGVLLLVTFAMFKAEPPAIGTLENHVSLSTVYVCTALGMLAYDPNGIAAIGAIMFVGPLSAVRLVDRREIVAHLLAATACVSLATAYLGATLAGVLGLAATLVAVWVLCGCCVLVLEAAEAQGEELEDLVRRDPLTGLGNRRVLTEVLRAELKRHARTRRPMAVITLDLDGFKAVNDTVGHAAGDELLQRVAAELAATMRPQDTLVRQGGDEFCLVLPESGPEHAERSANAVRAALSAAGIAGSLGIATFPRDAVHDKVLLHVADERMLEHKAAKYAAAAAKDAQAPGSTTVRSSGALRSPRLHDRERPPSERDSA